MCDPLTIAGVALTGASAFAGMQRASAIDKARAGAMSAERGRQKNLDNEAYGYNEDSRKEYDDFEGKRTEKAQTLEDVFSSNRAEVPAVGLPTNDNIVNQAVEKAKALVATRQDQQDSSLANLRAYGGTFADAGREQAKDAQMIGQIAGFKRGSQAVLPFELEVANNAGSGWGLLSDLAGGAGGLALNSGLSGGGFSFGSSAAAPKVASVGIPRPKPNSVVSLYG